MNTERRPGEPEDRPEPAPNGTGPWGAPPSRDAAATESPFPPPEAPAQPEAADPAIVEATVTTPDDALSAAPVAEPTPPEEPRAAAPARDVSGASPQPRAATRSASFVGKALAVLVLLIAGAFAGPMAAPYLPAPVAAYLAPSQELEPDAWEAIETLAERLSALEPRAVGAGEAADAAARAAETALAAASGASDRLAALDARLAELAAAPSAEGGVDPTLARRLEAALERLAEASERIDVLAEDVAALGAAPGGGADEATVSALVEQVAALDAALAEEHAARENAGMAVAAARRGLSLGGAMNAIDRALAEGAPFAEPLADAVAAVGVAPPPRLEEIALTGAPTREALKVGFAEAAHEAVEKALEAEAAADAGVFSQLLARVEARFTGIPDHPVEGDAAQAVLSRAKAALLGGDLEGAMALIDALPSEAAQALADWRAGAEARLGAETALSAWRETVGQAQ